MATGADTNNDYIDCQGWRHEYYKSPTGADEYVCRRGDVVITSVKNFVIVKCAPRSVVDKIDWLLNDIADSKYNNADIRLMCDVYVGEYIRVDICTDDGCYNVFNERNMFLFSGILGTKVLKKLEKIIV
ncbi:hypothetical protein F-LCD7_0086 [Faustovirus]|nr:hypothetical protein F-LCD7_0086 [Faustovirus]